MGGQILEQTVWRCSGMCIFEDTKIPWTVPEKDGITSEFDPAFVTALDQITPRIFSKSSHSIIL